MLTDRIRAVGNAWMGQTIGCAQCHDHKFDPITMRDFYELGAFFADIKEPILGRREPGMIVLDAVGEKKQADIAGRLTALQAEFARPRPELAVAQSTWEKKALEAVMNSSAWRPLKPLTATSVKKNVTLKADKDGIVRGVIDKKRDERKQNDGTDTYIITAKIPLGTTGIRLDALKEKSPGIGLASNGNFALSELTRRNFLSPTPAPPLSRRTSLRKTPSTASPIKSSTAGPHSAPLARTSHSTSNSPTLMPMRRRS
jgi:hypothetical protein